MTPLRFREAMRQSQCGTIRAGIVTAAVTVLQLLVEENGGRELVFLKHDVSLPGRRPIPIRRVSPSPGRRWTARSSFRRPALRRLGPRETMPHSICSTFTCNRNAYVTVFIRARTDVIFRRSCSISAVIAMIYTYRGLYTLHCNHPEKVGLILAIIAERLILVYSQILLSFFNLDIICLDYLI